MPLMHLISPLIGLAESGHLPDSMIRYGIRSLLRSRLSALRNQHGARAHSSSDQMPALSVSEPVAVVPELANEQHYEVPAAFFEAVIGPHRKYSSCHWSNSETLEAAEAESLRLTCQHADLQDGQRILELGCGWGSLSLWMAEHYPAAMITAISNSRSQREFIQHQVRERGLTNLEVRTVDINDLELPRASFDRVVSVEMFEHVRNHSLLMNRIARWLTPQGRLFVHIFCHRTHPYLFENDGPASWMARTFFSGGMMPSRDWLVRCEHPLQLFEQWTWNGTHYERTCNAWLERMDANDSQVAAILQQTYGDQWKTWRQRWRMFFMSCAELFGFHDGDEWFVCHYLFDNTSRNHD